MAAFETRNFADEETFLKQAEIPVITYRETEVLNGREALTYCMDTESFSLSTPTFFMRRDYLMENQIRFVEGILHEDVGYLLELITRAKRIRFLHRVYFLRRIRARSTMTVPFTDRNIEGYLQSFARSFVLEKEFSRELLEDPGFARAFCKWQRDIYGRIHQLYEKDAGSIEGLPGGHVNEEIRRAFAMIKLGHFRMPPLPFTECYLCGTGQYCVRAMQAAGAQDVVILGVVVLQKTGRAFRGFPQVLAGEIKKDIPVILSVSGYTKDAYRKVLEEQGAEQVLEMNF